MMVIPVLRNFCNICQNSLRETGSTPVVGAEDGLNYAAGKVYLNGALMGEGNVALGTFAKEGSQVFVGINCWDSLFKGAFDDIKSNVYITDGLQQGV